ncbi:hypothetical protein Syun_026856 [Stephania yunnanensis]|uniref:F-box domain-containing protein n=1 Tax=Stephania yunnanensis TaxID=152371 RepID=A0AAP0EEK3_9MAGN
MESVAGNERTIGIESLPREVMLNILLRLPIMSVWQCKSVCRTWRALAQEKSFSTMLFTLAAENNPSLILHHDSPIRNQLFVLGDDGQNGHYKFIRKITTPFTSIMPEFDVVGSCNGFLCLSDSLLFETICIYNPFTYECMLLPKTLHLAKHEVVIGFGFISKTNEYKVIRVVYYIEESGKQRRLEPRQQSQVEMLTLGKDSNWRSIGIVRQKIHWFSPKLLINGVLHWVITPYRRLTRMIIGFDFTTEKFEEVPCPRWERPVRNTFQLAEIQGCLSAVVNCKDGGIDIWVMKEYNVKESWIKELTIREYLPSGLSRDRFRPIGLWRNGTFIAGTVRLLCVLKCGKFLLEYENQALVCYDPVEAKFEELIIQGLPEWFQSVTHVGSLLSLEAPTEKPM